MGDEMTDSRHRTSFGARYAPALLIAGYALLIVSAAGAADRVVLGEYFTNEF
jgi:hypothetical protein